MLKYKLYYQPFRHSSLQHVMNLSNSCTSEAEITPQSEPCRQAIVSTRAALVWGKKLLCVMWWGVLFINDNDANTDNDNDTIWLFKLNWPWLKILISVLQNHQHPLKVESFETMPFTFIIYFQNENYPKSVLTRPPHSPKVKPIQISPSSPQHPSKVNCPRISAFLTGTAS